ncbi:MAG: hypothetical protein HN353_11445 [Bdellovibrionales bacterium]|nr:hypothetical protein [Bdellovibrionales bacterium]MBT3525730.1 hypothetical protein [Bdellovibrionales bacterium]
MKIAHLLCLTFFVMSLNLSAVENLITYSSYELQQMKRAERLILYNAYKNFMLAVEREGEVKSAQSYLQLLIDQAFAGGQRGSFCPYGGWPSSYNSKGQCQEPWISKEGKKYNKYGPSCGAVNKFRCHPFLSGFTKGSSYAGKCIKAKSKAALARGLSGKCAAMASDSDREQVASAAANGSLKIFFGRFQQDVKEHCGSGQRSSPCKILLNRLNNLELRRQTKIATGHLGEMKSPTTLAECEALSRAIKRCGKADQQRIKVAEREIIYNMSIVTYRTRFTSPCTPRSMYCQYPGPVGTDCPCHKYFNVKRRPEPNGPVYDSLIARNLLKNTFKSMGELLNRCSTLFPNLVAKLNGYKKTFEGMTPFASMLSFLKGKDDANLYLAQDGSPRMNDYVRLRSHGTEKTVKATYQVALDFKQRVQGVNASKKEKQLRVTAMSYDGGGRKCFVENRTARCHLSHGTGRDVDFAPSFTNPPGRFTKKRYPIKFKMAVEFLISLVRSGRVEKVFYNHPDVLAAAKKILGPKKAAIIQKQKGHFNHFHVRFIK